MLIEAIHKAKENNQDIKALIVGHEMDLGYRNKLKDKSAELGVADNIKFEDFARNPQQLMQHCDCIILASDKEPSGLLLPDALRSAVSVICRHSVGVP